MVAPHHHSSLDITAHRAHAILMLNTMPRVSKLDNLTEISRRLGAYSVSHYDIFAPHSSGGGGTGTGGKQRQ